MSLQDRANWLQEAAGTILRRIGIAAAVENTPPSGGLVVSNHLSYMDVLVYASVMPCIFVAKQEVCGWPVFGRFATMAGTIFVDRERQGTNRGVVAAMERALADGVTVVLFPEGTSSDGRGVLPFHSGFFEPAIRSHAIVTAAAIGYAGEAAEAQIAYYGNDMFGPHLWRTLDQRNVRARVIFSAQRSRYSTRKEAARTTQRQVEQLRYMVTRYSAANVPPAVLPQRAERETAEFFSAPSGKEDIPVMLAANRNG